MKNLLNAYRTLMLETKLWARIVASCVTGFALFCAVFATVRTVDGLIDGHRPFFVVASIAAVNIFLYHPAIMKARSKKSAPQSVNNPPKPVSVTEPVKEQTLADVGEEFAQKVTNISDEDLDEEIEEFC